MDRLRSVLAIVLGYVTMVAGTWFAQASLFPDTEYGAPLVPLMTMGIVTSIMGGTGGLVTALIAPRRPFLHLIPMGILIFVETIALTVQGRVHGPLWFELMAAAALVAGTVVGAMAGIILKSFMFLDRLRSRDANIQD
jgi:hypothetical protein